jgi:hypothetical protein
MQPFWKVAGIATLVGILGVVAIGTVAFAQEDDGAGWPFDFRARFKTAISEALGVSVEEYEAAETQAQEEVLEQAVDEGWLTEEQAEQKREWMAEGLPGRGAKGFMRPGMGPRGIGGHGQLEAVSELLGLTPQELMTELRDGKSIASLAVEKGVDTQVIVDAIIADLQEHLNEAVADGKLTQQRADWMLEQAREQVPEMLDKTFEAPADGGFRRGGPGRGWGFPGPNDTPDGESSNL